MMSSVDGISLYAFLRLDVENVKNMKIVAVTVCQIMMNRTDFLNPIASKRNPETDGPTNAPKAKTDVHKPEINP